MRLLKSVFLTAAFCALTVASYSQGVSRPPGAFSKSKEAVQSRGDVTDGAPGHHNRPDFTTSPSCTEETYGLQQRDELIALLKRRIEELKGSRTGAFK